MRWFNSPIGFGSSVINNLMFLSNKIIKTKEENLIGRARINTQQ